MPDAGGLPKLSARPISAVTYPCQRGVGHSEPDFACGEPGEQRALLKSIDGYIDTPEEIAAGEAAANLCIETMGPVGGRLHSVYVANDMDEIRQAPGRRSNLLLWSLLWLAVGALVCHPLPRFGPGHGG